MSDSPTLKSGSRSPCNSLAHAAAVCLAKSVKFVLGAPVTFAMTSR
jgi:hypothetical protein